MINFKLHPNNPRLIVDDKNEIAFEYKGLHPRDVYELIGNQEAKNDINWYKDEIKNLENEIFDLERQLSKLEDELNEAQDRIDELEDQLELCNKDH